MLVATRLRRARPAHRLADRRRRRLLVTAVLFSAASGIFHPYYVSLLAPFTAALVGAGAAQLLGGRLQRADRRARSRSPPGVAVRARRAAASYPGRAELARAGADRSSARSPPSRSSRSTARRVRLAALGATLGGAAARARGVGVRHPRPRRQRHLPRRRPGVGWRAAARPAPFGGAAALGGGGARRAARCRGRPCSCSAPPRSERAPARGALPGGARPGGAAAAAGAPGGFGGAPARGLGRGARRSVRRQRLASPRRSPTPRRTAAARSPSRASRARRRRSSARTPTWPASAASRGARATSASRGSPQRGARRARFAGCSRASARARRGARVCPGDTRTRRDARRCGGRQVCAPSTAGDAQRRGGRRHRRGAAALYDCAGRAAALASAERARIHVVRILVVDDDRAVREALRRALTLAGYEVQLAERRRAGARADRRRRCPTRCVLDIGLPGIDGLEVCRRVRRLGNRVPILMLTGARRGRRPHRRPRRGRRRLPGQAVRHRRAEGAAARAAAPGRSRRVDSEALAFAELRLDAERHGVQVGEQLRRAHAHRVPAARAADAQPAPRALAQR